MDWKTRARVQNVAGMLPWRLGNEIYYFAQRRFGGLRSEEPTGRLQAALQVVARIEKQSRSVSEATFLEIGTGHRMNVPLRSGCVAPLVSSLSTSIAICAKSLSVRTSLTFAAARRRSSRSFNNTAAGQNFDGGSICCTTGAAPASMSSCV